MEQQEGGIKRNPSIKLPKSKEIVSKTVEENRNADIIFGMDEPKPQGFLNSILNLEEKEKLKKLTEFAGESKALEINMLETKNSQKTTGTKENNLEVDIESNKKTLSPESRKKRATSPENKKEKATLSPESKKKTLSPESRKKRATSPENKKEKATSPESSKKKSLIKPKSVTIINSEQIKTKKPLKKYANSTSDIDEKKKVQKQHHGDSVEYLDLNGQDKLDDLESNDKKTFSPDLKKKTLSPESKKRALSPESRKIRATSPGHIEENKPKLTDLDDDPRPQGFLEHIPSADSAAFVPPNIPQGFLSFFNADDKQFLQQLTEEKQAEEYAAALLQHVEPYVPGEFPVPQGFLDYLPKPAIEFIPPHEPQGFLTFLPKPAIEFIPPHEPQGFLTFLEPDEKKFLVFARK